ncbi:MAG: YdcF family protein [Firmicutes bacterium]|nr:YdcF family protein [Bacillota bacterium]
MSQRLYEGMSLQEVTEFLFLSDPPEPADLILLFGGKRRERAEKAAALYRAGWAPRILITGGDKAGTGVPEAEELKAACLQLGVPETAIWTESQSLHTLENVLMSVPYVDARLGWENVKTVIAVSSPVHMRRVRQTLARHIPRGVRILCCPDDRTDVSRSNWWTTEEGRLQVFRELEKVRTYALQGEI